MPLLLWECRAVLRASSLYRLTDVNDTCEASTFDVSCVLRFRHFLVASVLAIQPAACMSIAMGSAPVADDLNVLVFICNSSACVQAFARTHAHLKRDSDLMDCFGTLSISREDLLERPQNLLTCAGGKDHRTQQPQQQQEPTNSHPTGTNQQHKQQQKQ
eukprot:6158537-Amphidinium_carterae.1